MKSFRLVMAGVSLVAAVPAHAVCAAASQYSFLFANQAAATLAYGSTYSYTASTTGGATRGFTVLVAQNGLSSTQVNSIQMPAIGTLITGPDATKRDLVIGGVLSGRTADLASNTRVMTATFTFTQPVRDFAMTVHDIDFTTNQYRDLVMITGVGNGVTYTPSLTSPWGNSNATGGSRTNASSSVTFGATTTPLTLTSAQAAGSGASANASDTGTIYASFLQPVTSITIRYGNAPFVSGENTTGQQAMGIAGVSFCPMPAISVAKTSAPNAGTYGAYAIPGNDVTYTLTVTNAGASPVDAGSIILTDVLPANVIFRNAVLDASTGSPFAIAPGSSGVILTAASAGYSSNGGTTWTYTPANGYDPAVNAVRVTPSGTMAANSAFAVTFVAQIR